MKFLLAAALTLPVLSGGLLLLIKKLRQKRAVLLAYTWTSAALTAALTLTAVLFETGTIEALRFSDSLSFSFFHDRVSGFFALLSVFVFCAALVYCAGYFKGDEREGNFYGFLLLSLGTLLGICFSENLLTAYACLELLTLSTAPLVMHDLTDKARHAGLKYLFYSIAGALTGLFGLFFADAYCSTLSFTAGGSLDAAKLAGHEGLFLAVCFAALAGFGVKAGLLPLSSWLATAHPAAPAPASALLSGIITKAGVLLSLRFAYYVVGADFLAGTWAQYAWMLLSALTILAGSALAAAEHDLKKRIAWSTVSQASYILLGLATFTEAGFDGALLHTLFHAIIKNALFMCCGIVIIVSGKHGVDALKGLGRRLPLTMGCYLLLGLALTGIPPLSAFYSKWKLLLGSIGSGTGALGYGCCAVLLLSALLTAYYMLSGGAFFSGKPEEPAAAVKADARLILMLAPVLLYAALTVFLGLFPNIPSAFVTQISDALFH